MTETREPIFNRDTPWAPLVLAGAILLGFATQAFTGEDIAPYMFSPLDLTDGRWVLTLLSSLFVHGGWMHVVTNAIFLVAFGTPLARYLSVRPGGAGIFVLFYLACGAVAGLGFAAVHWGQDVAVIGASGAVAGLAAAASRLIAGHGEMGRILSPPVLAMGGALLVMSLLTALFGLTPGASGHIIGWEAHLAGFAAGLVFSNLLSRLRPRA